MKICENCLYFEIEERCKECTQYYNDNYKRDKKSMVGKCETCKHYKPTQMGKTIFAFGVCSLKNNKYAQLTESCKKWEA